MPRCWTRDAVAFASRRAVTALESRADCPGSSQSSVRCDGDAESPATCRQDGVCGGCGTGWTCDLDLGVCLPGGGGGEERCQIARDGAGQDCLRNEGGGWTCTCTAGGVETRTCEAPGETACTVEPMCCAL